MQTHISVLTDEVIQALRLTESSTIVDATLGSSGHALRITGMLGTSGTFVGVDADRDAIKEGEVILKNTACTRHLIVGNFRHIDEILARCGVRGADGILADLGWRMEQFSESGKGFSFNVHEPLIMTFGDPKSYPFHARDIVNSWKEIDICNVLKGYGEERYAERIAR